MTLICLIKLNLIITSLLDWVKVRFYYWKKKVLDLKVGIPCYKWFVTEYTNFHDSVCFLKAMADEVTILRLYAKKCYILNKVYRDVEFDRLNPTTQFWLKEEKKKQQMRFYLLFFFSLSYFLFVPEKDIIWLNYFFFFFFFLFLSLFLWEGVVLFLSFFFPQFYKNC